MDVIANTRSIFGGIVRPKEIDLFSFAQGRLYNQRDKMTFMPVSFTQLFRSSSGVEIPKGVKLQPISSMIPVQHLFKHQLGFAISVNRILGMFFVNRDIFRLTKNSCGGGEDEFIATVPTYNIQQFYSFDQIVCKVLTRIGHGKLNGSLRCKMKYSINVVLSEYPSQHFFITKVILVESCL